ncbi:MAG: ATP-binding protein [Acidobacteriota bacterium]|nr:ATP-binding protein [Acidobacteriota bacterium]
MTRLPLQMAPLCDATFFMDTYHEGECADLGELLRRAPALCTQPLDSTLLGRPLSHFLIQTHQFPADYPLYRPPGLMVGQDGVAEIFSPKPPLEPKETSPDEVLSQAAELRLEPGQMSELLAVRLAYSIEIKRVAAFLRAGLSVLVRCDKLVSQFLYREMARLAGLRPILLEVEDEAPTPVKSPADSDKAVRLHELISVQSVAGSGKVARLRELIADLKDKDVLVVPHLDLMAGGDGNLTNDTREIVELLYGKTERLLLAFADRSMTLPEVLSNRFAVRAQISGLPRLIIMPDGTELPLGKALITKKEASCFTDYNADGLYKNVAGMSPVRLRQAITYAHQEEAADGPVPVERLYQAVRAFKAQTSANFEVPDVSFDDIGGYDAVKRRMDEVLALMLGAFSLPNEKLRRELIPRGFIFHGPPGTGKTLFAKAIANRLNATIQVVSGPEVTDMYVGESERKVRALFAEARRNAPAVLVFDEFDAIATQRSNRDDGGSRAGNALVAQILTEMDGFRPEVPVLVIGTTNRLDIIDDALLRPSRFQAIEIGLPDKTARLAIARVHARHFDVPVSDELLNILADAARGFNGDEIRSVFRDACVGLHCRQPPQAVDAERLGYLVGMLREAAETRAQGAAKRGMTLQRHRDRDVDDGAWIDLNEEEEDA